jgi:hypothetical protein
MVIHGHVYPVRSGVENRAAGSQFSCILFSLYHTTRGEHSTVTVLQNERGYFLVKVPSRHPNRDATTRSYSARCSDSKIKMSSCPISNATLGRDFTVVILRSDTYIRIVLEQHAYDLDPPMLCCNMQQGKAVILPRRGRAFTSAPCSSNSRATLDKR